MKEYLKLLLERDLYENTLPVVVRNLINNFDNNQLCYMLQNGLKISNDIVLYYYNGIGFRCSNENAHIIGNKPICGVIERMLNDKLVKS